MSKAPLEKPPPDDKLASKKLNALSSYTTTSPFPSFHHPTPLECQTAHSKLKTLRQEAVDLEFSDENTPDTIPHVLDAMVVAVLRQATGWSSAKRAMNSMKETYGSVFAYDEIWDGGSGRDKLQDTIKCGGLHVRKSMIIMSVLKQVREQADARATTNTKANSGSKAENKPQSGNVNENGDWDLHHMFDLSDEEAMSELLAFKYIGTKSASVVMGWCLKRNPFTVDTHVYRLAGLWGWRPEKAGKEQTQSHLEVMIPTKLKFDLHFLMIAHGRVCPVCKGGGKQEAVCMLDRV